jgi:hypothetical protein
MEAYFCKSWLALFGGIDEQLAAKYQFQPAAARGDVVELLK